MCITFVLCWANVEDVGPTLYKCYTDVLCLLGIAAGLVLLDTAGGDYKQTPTQCLLNVGPASPVLASMHSVLVSTSCCGYRHDALNQSWVNVDLPSVRWPTFSEAPNTTR